MGVFGGQLGCHVTNVGSFRVIGIPPKKRRETKHKLLTIPAQAETFQRFSVFINLMKQRNDLIYEAV